MTNYLRPSEIKDRHPEIDWTPQQIGWLFRLGLVDGIRGAKETLISEIDVLSVWELKNKLLRFSWPELRKNLNLPPTLTH